MTEQTMNEIELQNAKGTRDFPPEDKIIRQEVMNKLITFFERYGYSPLETPILERLDVLSAKYAGGAEILKETFSLKDQGDRDLCLRYDLTVPFCRFVGMNQQLKMPFKRYQIGEVFRDGPIKLGRYREFCQCDADVVGTKSMLADAECLMIAQDFFKAITLDVTLEVNNRKILNGMMESLAIPENKHMDVILAIDKIKKVPVKAIEEELAQKGVSAKKVDELLKICKTNGTNQEKIAKLRKILTSEQGKQGLDEMEECLNYLNQKNVVFSISLCRGLAYYTGTVFEGFLTDGSFTSSLCGGGRYDTMITAFLGKGDYPAVGISFGIEPIIEVLKQKQAIQLKKTVTQVYIIPIGTLKECIAIAKELRAAGVNTDLDLNARGVSKNLNYANTLAIPYVLFVGEEEVKQKKVKLREMSSGNEALLSVKEVCTKIKNNT